MRKLFAVGSSIALAASSLAVSALPAQAAAHTVGTNVSHSVLGNTTVGVILMGSNNTMCLADYTSAGAFLSYGFNSWSGVMAANADDLALAKCGAGSPAPMGYVPPAPGTIVFADRDSTGISKGTGFFVALSTDGGVEVEGFTSAAVFNGLGYNYSMGEMADVSWMKRGGNIDNATSHPAGSLILSGSTVYFIGLKNGVKVRVGVPSPEVFSSWGGKFTNAVPATTADMALEMSGVLATRQPGQLVPMVSGSGSNPSNPSGPLQGAAGSVEEYKLLGSPSNNQEVGEDDENVKVLGLSIEADDGSDLDVKAMRLELGSVPANPASDRFEDYADNVSIWYGTTKVAEADADEFNDDNDYSKTLSFTQSAIVRAGEIGNFYVAISGVSNLDSNDEGENWTVDVTSVRWVDAQDATISEDPNLAARTFSFEAFASANDLELNLTEADDNPDSQVVEADDSNDTNGVVLLKGKLRAEGGDIDLKGLLVDVTPAGTGDASEIASQYILKIDGDEVQSVDSGDCTVPGDCDGTGTNTQVTYDFDDVDMTIDEGDTVDLEILADISEIDGATVAEGDSLFATVNSDDFDAEDETGEDLTGGELTGAVTGEAQAFFSEGLKLEFISASQSLVNNDAATDQASFTIKFKASAFGTTVYIDKGTTQSTSLTVGGADGLRYDLQETAGTAVPSGAVLSATGSGVSELSNTFKINEGSSGTFTFTVTGTPSVDASIRTILYGIEWRAADDDTTGNVDGGTQVYHFDMGVDGDYKTDYVFTDFV